MKLNIALVALTRKQAEELIKELKANSEEREFEDVNFIIITSMGDVQPDSKYDQIFIKENVMGIKSDDFWNRIESKLTRQIPRDYLYIYIV